MTHMSTRPARLIQAIRWLGDTRNDPVRYATLGAKRLRQDISNQERAVLHAVLARVALASIDVNQAILDATAAVELDEAGLSGLDDQTRATLHCVLVRCLILADRLADAEEHLERAEQRFGTSQGWQFDQERATMLYKRGRLRESLEAIERVFSTVPDDQLSALARAYNGRGILKLYLGGDSSGLNDLESAEQLYLDLGQDLDAADVMFNKAMALGRQGDLPRAFQAFAESRRVLERRGQSIDQLVVAKAEILLLAGLVEDVVDELPDVIERLEAAGMVADAAEARLYLASAQLALNDPAAADSAHRTTEQFRLADRSGWAAISDDIRVESLVRSGEPDLVSVADAWAVASELDAAGMRTFSRRSWLRVAELARRSGQTDVALASLARVTGRTSSLPERVDAHLAQAWQHVLTGDVAGARRTAERGFRLIQRNRSFFDSTDLRVQASDWGQAFADLLLELAWSTASAAELLTTAERWRAGGQANRRSAPPAELWPLVREYRAAAANAAHPQAQHAVETSCRTRSGSPNERLLRSERALVEALRTQPGPGRERAKPFDLHALQQDLHDRAFIELICSQDHLRAIVVTVNEVNMVELGSLRRARSTMGALQHSLSRLAFSPSGAGSRLIRSTAESAMARLVDDIIAPVIDVTGPRSIIVSPVSGLGALPWPLLAKRAACIVPSARWWMQSPPRVPRDAHPHVSVCVGPGLPGAHADLRSIAENYPDAIQLVGDQTTVEAVLEQCRNADLIHLACHATFRARNPLLSSLTMNDGPLAAFELERLTPPPAAAVLAACSSGAVRHYAAGDGLGLSMALLAAGTQMVVSATLPLPDAAAGAFLARFHHLLAAGDAAWDALHHTIGATDLADSRQLTVAAAMLCHGRGDWRVPGYVPRSNHGVRMV